VGGKERTGRPGDEGGRHPKGRNEEKDLERSGRLRAAALGLEGSDAHPAGYDVQSPNGIQSLASRDAQEHA
jgi:hypothetical protein